jgi:amino acid transporter
MASGLKKGEKLKGRNFALTIILGVFIAVMVIVLFNLIVGYVYEPPKYENYCNETNFGPYPVKYGVSNEMCGNCTFSKTLQEQTERCYQDRGMPVYDYDEKGCTKSIRECDMCSKNLDNDIKSYNRNTFFVYALIGFVLIILGLYVAPLLVQIVTLPAGAVLVIQAAMENFDDKLLVIITFALLIIAAVVLAVRKLK